MTVVRPSAALQRLRPRPPQPVPRLVRREDVPAWDWTGMHLDGTLVPLWRDVSRRADVPESPTLRAAALAPLVPARGVLGRLSAVWVHTGRVDPPRRVDVLVPSGARRPEPHPDRQAAEAELRDDDVLAVGPVRVTGVTRTAVDVARWVPPAPAVRALRALVEVGLDPAAVHDVLAAAHGGRGVRTARRTLALV